VEVDVSRITKPLVAVTLATGLVLGGNAMAATIHSTHTKLDASRTTVHEGQKVIFEGHLRSGFDKCKTWRPVTLYRNGEPLATKQTSKTGQFKFTRKINHTKTWQVRFAGRTGGVHPDQWICKASLSKKIKVVATK
jgi:hypothetical protein